MARPARRSSNLEFPLVNANVTLGVSYSRRVSYAGGERLVEEGRAIRLVNIHTGATEAYQLTETRATTDESLPSLRSSAAINMAEMMANAGTKFKHGKSRTSHLGVNDERRDQRVCARTGKRLAPEDFVERAVEKVKLWGRR